MRQLLRWPNGETRVIDPEAMLGSDWFRFTPQGPLTSISLDFSVGEPAAPSASGSTPQVGKFKNTALTISSKASNSEWLAWVPGGFEVVRVEGGPPGTDFDLDAPVDIEMQPIGGNGSDGPAMLSKLRSQMLHHNADKE